MTTVLTPPSADSTGHGVAQARGLFDGNPGSSAERFHQEARSTGATPQPGHVRGAGRLDYHSFESFAHPSTFTWSITIWLFLTVIFANFAEAMAEGRGKAQADTLRKMRSETEARRLRPDGTEELVPRRHCKRVTSSSVKPTTSSF